MKIEFRDLYDFEAAYSYSTTAVLPASTCAVSCTTLAYLDSSSKPRRIQLLDCSKIPVKATGKIQTEENDVCSMTAVSIGGRLLLVTAGKITTRAIGGGSKLEDVGNEIHAYDVNQGKLVWITKGKLPGMVKELCAEALTSDGQGHRVCLRHQQLLCTDILMQMTADTLGVSSEKGNRVSVNRS